MPRPEENGPLPHGNGQGKYLRRLRPLPCEISLRPGQRKRQVARLIFGDAIQQRGGQDVPQPILCGNVGEQHPHIAAADHADVVRVAAAELVVPDVAVTGFQKLPGVKDGKIFHIAAADGARLGPLGIHQHLCAGTPGSGAGFPNDGRQNGVTALFHFIQQFCKDHLHADHPFCLCIADTYSTLFSEKKQHNLFGHAELLLHRADFFVARKPGV